MWCLILLLSRECTMTLPVDGERKGRVYVCLWSVWNRTRALHVKISHFSPWLHQPVIQTLSLCCWLLLTWFRHAATMMETVTLWKCNYTFEHLDLAAIVMQSTASLSARCLSETCSLPVTRRPWKRARLEMGKLQRSLLILLEINNWLGEITIAQWLLLSGAFSGESSNSQRACAQSNSAHAPRLTRGMRSGSWRVKSDVTHSSIVTFTEKWPRSCQNKGRWLKGGLCRLWVLWRQTF